ncbi:HD domain-containing protein [Sulfobacillus thermosulfidooxidans DSM 9293]|uniref:HD domain-containing protein n=1 Tax=Sulfobacillus thermosulfidooxidans (strain DSM 9293 / VKM B-1269 / AT-1) TaxID=929705 RepID=A0A1W1W8V2_SULTA|nr:HD domain-containing phosphohydrolase [Sulfobacillus thermosulfidooxidans]SMC02173.1 HD domain-containing protein [Sulfobacillus thermosulfidooxidans DSM 9293]
MINYDPAMSIPTAELVAALSRALDLTEGEPMGHAMRTCWIGMEIGRHLDLPEKERAELYYALLLKDAGCSANAQQVAEWFGTDDRSAKYALKSVNWSNLWHAMRYAVSQAKVGAPLAQRIYQIVSLGKRGQGAARELVEMRCTRGADVVRELGWVNIAPQAVLNLDEHWDGSGHPRGLKGEEIPILARILNLAQTVEIFWNRSGPDSALQVAQDRKGTWFDPELVDIFLAIARPAQFWYQLNHISDPHSIAALDPDPSAIPLNSLDQLLHIARVFGEIVDTKSSWTAMHSMRTARVAAEIAEIMGLSKRLQEETLLAGFFHDLGKLGVSNLILDKPGRLDEMERREIEKHPQWTYHILEPLSLLHPVAVAAASHHERLDGCGYHLGLKGQEIPLTGQIVAVADVYDALAHARPYRRQLDTDEVLAIMRPDAGIKLSGPAMEALEWGLSHRSEPFYLP